MSTIDKKLALERFDDFIIEMEDQLDALHELAVVYGMALDMSAEDFERLERLFDLVADVVDSERRKDLVVSFARYLGELVCSLFGGKWILALSDETSAYYNQPVIVGHGVTPDVEFSPIMTMRAYSLKKRPGTIRRAVMAHIRPEPLDLSHLAGG
jgi:hypothetical protein